MSSSESLHFKLGLDGAEEVGSMAALSNGSHQNRTVSTSHSNEMDSNWCTEHTALLHCFFYKGLIFNFFFVVVSVIVAKLQTRVCLVCLHTQG